MMIIGNSGNKELRSARTALAVGGCLQKTCGPALPPAKAGCWWCCPQQAPQGASLSFSWAPCHNKLRAGPHFLLTKTKLPCLLGVSTGHARVTCCRIRALPTGSWWRFQRSPFPRPLRRRLLARLTCSWQTCFSMLRKQFQCLREYYSRPESSDLYSTFTPSGE